MSKNKDIFNLFRESEQHLEEMPSPEAWKRLEKRLEPQKQSAKIIRFRSWAVAASLLLVLGLLSILSTYLIQSQNRYANLEKEVALMEDLSFTDATSYDVSRLHHDYARTHIEEGKPNKKLVAAINYFYSENEPDEQTLELASRAKLRVAPSVSKATSQNFDWLIGNWKGKTENGNSVEQWVKYEDVFYGTGYLIQKGDTIFMERMKLVKKGTDWYYVLQLDSYSKSSFYKLSSYNKDRIVFTSNTQQFPASVVLSRNAEDEFSTQLLAAKNIELSLRQFDFLTKRNVLLIDRAVRNLMKAG